MTVDIGIAPLAILRVTAAWAVLEDDQRRQFLKKWLARLAEFQVAPNGVVWASGKSDAAGDIILMLWHLTDSNALEALMSAASDPDVRQYFEATLAGGQPVTDQEMVWKPFLRG